MGKEDDFKNFLVIHKIEEEKDNKTLFEALLKNRYRIGLFILIIIFIIFIYRIFFSNINTEILKKNDYLFEVKAGENINSIANDLKEEKIISSTIAFKIYMRLTARGELFAQTGIYKFTEEDSLSSVARKIVDGNFAISPIRVTIPEGSTNDEAIKIISDAFSSNQYINEQDRNSFSIESLKSLFEGQQGYFFPETYFFLPNIKVETIPREMKRQFYISLKDLFENLSQPDENKIIHIYSNDLKPIDLTEYFDEENNTVNINKKLTIVNDLGTTTLSIDDIVTMASFLEGEANNEKDMKMVSGILWSRIKLGYLLQIDAATTTYKIKGLTKNPINNPGIIAIKSAILPTESDYLYYITGNDGNMYYARDYKTHLENIKKYLKKKR